MNSSDNSGKEPSLLTLALIVLVIVAGGLSSIGLTAINHPEGASTLAQVLAWLYLLFLNEGWGQLDSHGHVSVDLWFKVFIAESGAIVIVIVILVVSGMALWRWLVRLFERRGKGNRVR